MPVTFAVRGPVALPGGAYTANAVGFDGTNDILTRGGALSGAPSAMSSLLISFWFKLLAGGVGDGNFQMFMEDDNGGSQLQVLRMTDNTIRIMCTENTCFQFSTASTYTLGGGWKHLLATWDGPTTTVRLYINDVSDLAGSPTVSNAVTNWTTPVDWAIGARLGLSVIFCGEMADFYVNPGTSTPLDISNVTNRRKFIDGSGKPVDLGATGSLPTGSQPLIFLKNPFSSWQNNAGSGGNFTVTGALTAGTPP